LAGSIQSYCKNKHAYVLAHPIYHYNHVTGKFERLYTVAALAYQRHTPKKLQGRITLSVDSVDWPGLDELLTL